MKRKIKTMNKHFRCSAEDARRLELAATKAGVSESEYLRTMIDQVAFDNLEKTEEDSYPEISEQLDGLRNEIHKIGVNINQIAHACNMNPAFYREDRDKLMYYMQSCRKLLLEVVEYCNHKDDAHELRKRE